MNRSGQRGAVLLLMLLVMLVGGMYFGLSEISKPSIDYERHKITNQVLAQAKQALISYALLKTDYRPGALPCPDTHVEDDARYGTTDLFFGEECPAYIGRLPWETLRMDTMPQDGSGARIWYALSSKFRDHEIAQPINSDTSADLTIGVYRDSTPLTSDNDCAALVYEIKQVVAILFAPGYPLARLNQAAYRNNTADIRGYLEGDNLNGDSVFALCLQNNTDWISADLAFNDQLLFVTRDELMRMVERRVMGEVKQALNTYYDEIKAYFIAHGMTDPASGHYPWLVQPHPVGGVFQPTVGTTFGWVPYEADGLWFDSGFEITYQFNGGIMALDTSLVANTVSEADLTHSPLDGASLPLSITIGCDNSACGKVRWQIQDGSKLFWAAQGQAEVTDLSLLPAGVAHRHYAFDVEIFLSNDNLTQFILDSASSMTYREVVVGAWDALTLLQEGEHYTLTITDTDSSGAIVGQGSIQAEVSSTPSAQHHIALKQIRYNPKFPSWYVENQWHKLTLAAIGQDYAPGGGQVCDSACLKTAWLQSSASGVINNALDPYQENIPALVLAAGTTIHLDPALFPVASPYVDQDRITNPMLDDFVEQANADGDVTHFAMSKTRLQNSTQTQVLFNDQLLPFAPQ